MFHLAAPNDMALRYRFDPGGCWSFLGYPFDDSADIIYIIIIIITIPATLMMMMKMLAANVENEQVAPVHNWIVAHMPVRIFLSSLSLPRFFSIHKNERERKKNDGRNQMTWQSLSTYPV